MHTCFTISQSWPVGSYNAKIWIWEQADVPKVEFGKQRVKYHIIQQQITQHTWQRLNWNKQYHMLNDMKFFRDIRFPFLQEAEEAS